MEQAVKLEQLLRLVTDGVCASLSEHPDRARAIARAMDRPATTAAASRRGHALASFVASAAMCELLRHIRQIVMADGSTDPTEIEAVRLLLQRSAHRFTGMAGYSRFARLTTPSQVTDVLSQWSKDTGDFGGCRQESTDSLMLNALSLMSSAIRADASIFDEYVACIELVLQLVAGVGGTNSDERKYTAAFRAFNSEMKDRELPRLLELVPPPPDAERPRDPFPQPSEKPHRSRTEALAEARRALGALIDREGIKKQVAELVDFLQVRRPTPAFPRSMPPLHFIFTGSPGTGKSTVARIISTIFYGCGRLDGERLTEVCRDDLVAGDLAQTAVQTSRVLVAATGGVLFIDELSTLDPSASRKDDFGREALATLLTHMDELRDRLVVIAAGSPARMRAFLEAHPELESRFARFMHFADYDVRSLCQIFSAMCERNSFVLTPMARGRLVLLFSHAYRARDDAFGNARFVRKVFGHTLGLHTHRLAGLDREITREMLTTIEGDDIALPADTPADVDEALADSSWRGRCPTCGREFHKGIAHAGRRMTCACGCRFAYPPWNLISTPYFAAHFGYVESDGEADVLGTEVDGAPS